MISFGYGKALFDKISQNSSSLNQNFYGELANIEHRYLLQKYFGNQGSFNIQTIGQTSLTLVNAVPIGSTSCTLASAWPYQTVQAQLTFSDGENVLAQFTSGSTNVTWLPVLQGTLFYTTNSISTGATSAILQSAWTNPNANLLTSFSDGSTKTVTYINGSTAISWTGGLAENVGNQIYTSTIAASSNASIGGVQFYPFPPNYSKLKDITITVGELKWTLTEIRTREEWDNLNVFPYYASIPSKFFIYPGGDKGGQIGIWPIPSTTGNVITYNYKFRVPDLSLPDYGAITYSGLTGSLYVGATITSGSATATIMGFTSTNIAIGNISGTVSTGAFTCSSGASGTISQIGTVSVNNGSMAITGVSTSFIPTTNPQLESRWIQFPQPTGDGLWYQIASVNSTTGITLYQPYQGTSLSGVSGFVIGQMPLIAEDFQDMLPWKVLQYYASTITDKPEEADLHLKTYNTKLELLQEYSGSNTINVNLSPKGKRRNPNPFPYNGIGTQP